MKKILTPILFLLVVTFGFAGESMSNHYHLAIETPDPNLVVGMKWLQSTFAAR